MAENTELKLLGKPDWRWVGMGYCFFVVFHLLPTTFLMILSRAELGMGWNIGTLVWLYFGLALVGGYIGYKSRGVTIVEPAISAALYTLTLMVSVRAFWGLSVGWESTLWSGLASMLAAFAVAFVSAWIGEIVQLKRAGQRQAT